MKLGVIANIISVCNKCLTFPSNSAILIVWEEKVNFCYFSLILYSFIIMKPLLKEIVIHCKPAVLNIKPIKNGYLNWNYSKQFGKDEIDVILVDDSDLDDEELCELHNIDYDLVNCIELLSCI